MPAAQDLHHRGRAGHRRRPRRTGARGPGRGAECMIVYNLVLYYVILHYIILHYIMYACIIYIYIYRERERDFWRAGVQPPRGGPRAGGGPRARGDSNDSNSSGNSNNSHNHNDNDTYHILIVVIMVIIVIGSPRARGGPDVRAQRRGRRTSRGN